MSSLTYRQAGNGCSVVGFPQYGFLKIVACWRCVRNRKRLVGRAGNRSQAATVAFRSAKAALLSRRERRQPAVVRPLDLPPEMPLRLWRCSTPMTTPCESQQSDRGRCEQCQCGRLWHRIETNKRLVSYAPSVAGTHRAKLIPRRRLIFRPDRDRTWRCGPAKRSDLARWRSASPRPSRRHRTDWSSHARHSIP